MRLVEPAFVGRTRELDALAAALDDARARRGRFVLLLGDGGIGKTRTVEEFVRSAACPPDRVLWGRCPEQEGAPAYWPWVRALQTYVEACEPSALAQALGTGAAALARLVPELRHRLPGLAADDGAPEASRFVLFDAVAGFLRRAAAHEPLVLVFDDLHWADESSLLLLAFLARELRDARVLIVATARRELHRGPRGLADLARAGRTLVLEGLAAEAVADLLEQSSAEGAVGADAVARLVAASDGNPMFLLELLRAMREDGDAGEADVRLPEGLRASIRRRLEPLAGEARELVALAAVIGRDFDLPVLAAAAGTSTDATLAGLTPAIEAGLVDEHAGAFRFRHALVREAAYGDLLPATRAALHRRVGLAGERLRSPDVEAPVAELAVHFFHAAPLGESERAVGYATRAGARAMTRLAFADAVGHYERALRACSLGGIDDDRVVRLWLALGGAAHRAGDARRAQDAYERAARSARGRGDVRAFADAALGAYRVCGRTGVVDRAVTLLEEALGLLGDADDGRRAAVLSALALGLHFADDADRRDAYSSEAVTIARRVGSAQALAVALAAQHTTLLAHADLSSRMAITAEGFRLTAAGDAAPWLQRCRIVDLIEAGDSVAAEQQVDVYAHQAERSGLPHLRWHARVLRGTLALLAGRFAEAERLSAEALATRRDGRDPTTDQVFFLASLGRRRETTGAADLETHNRALIDAAPTVMLWRATLGLILLDAGRAGDARRIVDMLVPRDAVAAAPNGHHVVVLAALAELTAGLGDADRATIVYERLRAYDGRAVIVHPFTALCLGAVARYLGLLAATCGDGAAAERHWTDALATNARMGAWPQLAHTQHELGRLLRARGDGARATALAEQARRTAETLGMVRLLSALDACAPPADAAAPPVDGAVARLRREGEYWTLAYGDELVRLRHAKGIGFLRQLLANPGRELHVLDLAAERDPGAAEAVAGDAGEVLDREAQVAYRRRLADLHDELAEARRFDDGDRIARAEREAAFLNGELARGVGLGGRSRRAASDAERARVNVSRTIQAIVRKIAAESPALGQLLLASVHTGLFCSYEPDPRLRLRWEL